MLAVSIQLNAQNSKVTSGVIGFDGGKFEEAVEKLSEALENKSELKEKLQELRALMGPDAANQGWAELIRSMADLSVKSLKVKRFGKKRVNQGELSSKPEKSTCEKLSDPMTNSTPAQDSCIVSSVRKKCKQSRPSTLRGLALSVRCHQGLQGKSIGHS